MFRNYFKISWRNLSRSKGYSLINIGGLALGMAVALVIGLWVHDELTFNHYHDKHERLAWVMQNQTFEGEIQTWESQAKELAPVLREEYGTYFEEVLLSTFINDLVLRQENKAINKTGYFMEPAAPELLSLRMLSGTRDGLRELNSILISASTAEAFFGKQDPIGEIIQLGENFTVAVTGVYEDIPENSTFTHMQFVAPWKLAENNLPNWVGWGNSWFQILVQVNEQASMAEVSQGIKNAKMERIDEGDSRFKPELFLHPMGKMHLYSEFENGKSVGGRIRYVWMFGIIGAFVLVLACINFMNLSTARSEKRSKEIGIRKAIGSRRRQLIQQFYVESVIIATLAFAMSLMLVQLSLPFFNEIAQKEITLLWQSLVFWLICVAFIIFTAMLAGSYPAVYLSSLKAVRILKGAFKTGKAAALPRKVLVIVQFAVSVSLIIGTAIVFQQIEHVKNRPLGYQTSRLLNVPIKNEDVNQSFDAVRQELLQTGLVDEVAKSEGYITRSSTTNSGLSWRGKPAGMQDEFVTMRVSHEFGSTIDWNIVEGRDFSREFSSDSMGFIINQAAAEYMGLDDPIGEQIKWGDNGTYTVVGVVENMVTQSPYEPTKQMIFFIDYKRSRILNIKLSPEVSPQQAIAGIEDVIKKFDPVNPFSYDFADEQYARKFGSEERIGKLAGIFAILAIFISCIGLFGMASYVAERRVKEIGIRKVLGASVIQLWHMLSKEFVLLVFISCLIAAPVAYYFLEDWLASYTYRIEISGWIFVASILLALLVTLVTVSFQSVKAALMNPVKSLRNE